jgi:hypothetical protein
MTKASDVDPYLFQINADPAFMVNADQDADVDLDLGF